MPNLDIHADNAAPVILGVGTIIYGVFQAEIIVTFLCAILGSGIGLAFLPAPPLGQTRFYLVIRFLINAAYMLITAIIVMFAMHWLRRLFAGAEYPVAFFASMALMLFKERIINAVGRLIDRKIDGV